MTTPTLRWVKRWPQKAEPKELDTKEKAMKKSERVYQEIVEKFRTLLMKLYAQELSMEEIANRAYKAADIVTGRDR